MKAIVYTPTAPLLIADSAIGRDSMPLFIPDGSQWQGNAFLAFRVERLGKNVSAKFALRYIDAMGIVVLMRPAGPVPPSLGYMDSALTTGQWLPLPADPTVPLSWNWSVQELRNPQAVKACGTICWPEAMQAIEDMIADVSRTATIKTGDILVPEQQHAAISLEPDTRLVASIASTPALSLKIK